MRSVNAATSPAAPRLAWLAEALGARSEGADGQSAMYRLLPSGSRPQLLVPVGERGAAWASLRQHSDAAPLKVRLTKELMAWACRLGLAAVLFPGVVREEQVGLHTGSCAWSTLIEEVFGRRDFAIAVSVGQVRPQIKPILHVITRSGLVLGHVKIGWNGVTRSLVQHEAAILTVLASEQRGDQAPRPAQVRVPQALYQGRWQGREVLVVSDIGSGAWYRRCRRTIPASATRQVAHARGVRRVAVGASEFWLASSGRARGLINHPALDRRIADALARAVEGFRSRHADDQLDFGLVHGDWAPWNMASIGPVLAVWDWERAGMQGPTGFDSVYFSFQVDLWLRRLTPEDAVKRTVRCLPGLMRASGARPQNGSVVLQLVLLEIVLRQLEGVAAGAVVPERVYRALTGLLARVGDER
jgi:hypothetical protein